MPANRQAFGDQNATARTSLARERRRHGYDSPTGACCLVGEDAQERRPPSILDTLGEMVIPEHVGRLQVLVINHIIGTHQGERRLMMKVLPLAAHRLMRLGEQDNRFPATMAPYLAPRDPALRGLQCPLGFAIPTGRKDACAIREGTERFYPKVNAGLLSSWRQRLYWHIGAREADVPAIRLFGDRNCLGRPLDGS